MQVWWSVIDRKLRSVRWEPELHRSVLWLQILKSLLCVAFPFLFCHDTDLYIALITLLRQSCRKFHMPFWTFLRMKGETNLRDPAVV